MSIPGIPIYWTKERLNALQKLAKQAYNRGEHLDWDYARSRLPRENKLLKNKTNNQLSKAWSMFKKSIAGMCYSAGCKNPRDTEALHCYECRKHQSERAKSAGDRVYMSPILAKNKKEIVEIIDKKSREELKNFVFNHLNKFPIKSRKALLGDEFKNIIKSKRRAS